MVRRALVTGDLGFVGRNMSRVLTAAGYDVYGLDIKRAPSQDVRDVVRRWAVAGHAQHFDVVVHAAAVVGGRLTIDGAPLHVAVDLAIDAEIFRYCLATRPGRLIYYSSSAAYPTVMQEPGSSIALGEDWLRTGGVDAIGMPDQTYGWAKVTGEILADVLRAEGVPVTVLRPFSGYGADQDLDYPFPSFIDRAVRRVDPFPVWGDGEQVRDFVHINDIVALTLTCIEEGIDGPLNICTGRPTSFNDLARLVIDAVGDPRYGPEIAHDLDKPVGVSYRVGDPTRMSEVYTPRISLEDGIRRALRHAAAR